MTTVAAVPHERGAPGLQDQLDGTSRRTAVVRGLKPTEIVGGRSPLVGNGWGGARRVIASGSSKQQAKSSTTNRRRWHCLSDPDHRAETDQGGSS